MKKTIGTIAAAVLMASTVMAPAFAQTETTPAAPAAPAAPSDPAATTPAPTGAATDMSDAGAAGYITEQSPTQVSANDYIGKSIHNANDETIGNVNDLIMEENGGIVAAVVGVGGFLGIGEKSVALPMDKITMTRDAENNNNVRLTTTETAEALQSAPEFRTLADMQAGTDGTTTSSTTTPAEPADPAMPAAPATGGDTTPSTAPQQ
jgi:hypothetical protein